MKLSEIKILHITNNLGYGGVQKIIYQLCKLTKSNFEKIKVASAGGIYVEKLLNLDVEHFLIPDLSTKNFKEVVKIIKILNTIVKSNSINVIHCHHRMAVFYAKIISKFQNIKIIYNNHTIYSDRPKSTHFILKNVNIIADGVQAKNNVVNFFKISQNKITTINNAVDQYDGIYKEINEIKEKKSNGDFIVMNASRLHPQKGINYFIDAAEILIKKNYNISFFIVGDGPLKSEMVNLVNSKKLNQDITFLGFRQDIKNVISQSDVLVLTSVYEGLPLTPMEAFSVKKPVIGTDIDGTREVITNEYNGFLADNMNPDSIANKIEKLYLDKDKLVILGQNAYSTYLKKFSLDNFFEAYLDYYSKI